MQDSAAADGLSFPNQCASVVLRISRMDDDGFFYFASERDLGRECRALGIARRIIVVIVESTLTDRDTILSDQLAQLRNVARRVEVGRVVRMDARGRKDESPVPRGIPGRRCRGREGFADADDRSRARLAGARDYRVAVAGERRVREVGVAVDEDRRASVRRGHLRSIQRSTGAAT